MDTAQFVQKLIGDGFNISLSEDGEKIKLSSTNGKLDSERRQYIQDNKTDIIAHLRRKVWNPKVARGATQWIIIRAQRHISEMPPKQRAEYIEQLAQLSTPVWEAFNQQDRWKLIKALTDLDSFAKDWGINARGATWKQTPARSPVSVVSKLAQG